MLIAALKRPTMIKNKFLTKY